MTNIQKVSYKQNGYLVMDCFMSHSLSLTKCLLHSFSFALCTWKSMPKASPFQQERQLVLEKEAASWHKPLTCKRPLPWENSTSVKPKEDNHKETSMHICKLPPASHKLELKLLTKTWKSPQSSKKDHCKQLREFWLVQESSFLLS